MRSARAGRIDWVDAMAFVSLVLPVLMLPALPELFEPLMPEPLDPCVPPLMPEPELFCVVVPVVPIAPPVGFCVPAAVAGFGDDVVGGVPCAKAAPDAASASAAMRVDVLFMLGLQGVKGRML